MAESVPTFALWTGDGSTTQFSFSFPYQQPADVFVTVDGSPVSTVFVTSQTVQITPAPAVGADIRIFRSTPAETVANSFQLGAPFLPENIDENFEQSLFVLQEGLDAIDLGVGGAVQAAEDAAALAQATADAQAAFEQDILSAQAAFEQDIQGQQTALANRTLRAPLGEVMPPFPPAAERVGRTLVFDGNGDPVLVAGSDASSLAAALADWNQGGNIVGYDATRSVTQAIDEALAAGMEEILIEDVTGLQDALDGKATLVHTHGISDVTGLVAALNDTAPLVHQHSLADVVDSGGAAFMNVGVSGNTVPVCQNNTQWGNTQTLVGSAGGARLNLQANAGTLRDVVLRTGSTARWNFGANNDPETGGNAGSNFELMSYSDFGGAIGKAVQVRRADGATLLQSAIGGFMGDGTLNAKGLFVNGQSLAGFLSQGPSAAAQGRAVFPNGLELKWGRMVGATSNNPVTQNFEVPFQNKAMVAMVTLLNNTLTNFHIRVQGLTASSITAAVGNVGGDIMWFVVGH